MFKNFKGFHLLEEHSKAKQAHREANRDKLMYHKAIKLTISILVGLILWNLPPSAFGIADLTMIEQRVIAIFALLR